MVNPFSVLSPATQLAGGTSILLASAETEVVIGSFGAADLMQLRRL
jgi:hypothetical protein